jgi:L-ascorbate metabolism protein UlaG (beta-lactamase superfamily)
MKYSNIKINWLGHSGFKIDNSKVIYIDPFRINQNEKANLILITHEHYDHLSLEDINKIYSDHTIIIASNVCKSSLINFKNVKFINPGNKLKIDDIEIEAVYAYNVNKFRSPGIPYHQKEDKKLGYILTVNNTRIYHAGDTDLIPEMNNLKNIDIALLPVSGKYVMDVNEAVEAVKIIKPKLAIPMHYASIVGTKEDAKNFQKLANKFCKVEIL